MLTKSVELMTFALRCLDQPTPHWRDIVSDYGCTRATAFRWIEALRTARELMHEAPRRKSRAPTRARPLTARVLRVLREGPSTALEIAVSLRQPAGSVKCAIHRLRGCGVVKPFGQVRSKNGPSATIWQVAA